MLTAGRREDRPRTSEGAPGLRPVPPPAYRVGQLGSMKML